jgi:phosphatidylglycerophosphate synthase
MMTLSNFISLLRFPLAFLFLFPQIPLRLTCIFLAMFTDCIDGYLARRNQTVTKLGTILDPAMDKFFVYFVIVVLSMEGSLELWQALAMVSRDLALAIYGIYLTIIKKWKYIQFQAIRWGKIATALQFLVLIGLTLNITIPFYVYGLFIVIGILALIELFRLPLVKI